MEDQDKIASKFGIHKSLLDAVRGVVSGNVVEEEVEEVQEAEGSRPQDKTAGESNPVMQGSSGEHKCAKQVAHEEYGVGKPIFGQHAEPDRYGNVAWYDVMFDHGVEERLPVTEMKVIDEMNHGNHKKKMKESHELKYAQSNNSLSEAMWMGTIDYTKTKGHADPIHGSGSYREHPNHKKDHIAALKKAGISSEHAAAIHAHANASDRNLKDSNKPGFSVMSKHGKYTVHSKQVSGGEMGDSGKVKYHVEG